MKKILLAVLILFCGNITINAQKIWQDAIESKIQVAQSQRELIPTAYRVVNIDMTRMMAQLSLAPMENSDNATASAITVELPMPDGNTMHFKVVESPIMERALSDKYPLIHTYSGISVEDPTATTRFDVTSRGFNAMVLSNKIGSFLIAPYSKTNSPFHIVFNKKDLPFDRTGVTCGTQDDPHLDDLLEQAEAGNARFGDGKLRNYRLALGCTGEYGTYHGGTKTSVLAAFTTAVNQLNAIFAREASTKLILIGNTDNLIYTSAGGDPYSNNSTVLMLDEHQTNTDLKIGTSGYDIGHLFTMAGGGIAQLQSPCGGGKARANSGHPGKPVGPGFIVNIVAHEMGHQFGCTHSYNNDCSGNISKSTAYEVLSGATIMSYAGVCPPNMQNDSDPYYHAVNITQFLTFINTGNGKTCALVSTTGNTPPVANAGLDRTIPKSTSLELLATATDANSDTLFYTWDQMDLALNGDKAPTSTSPGPLFQFRAPSLSPSRYLPNITDLVNNINPKYEVLPTIDRNLNFRLTVRDIHASNGSSYGYSDKDDLKLTVDANSGPFLLTKPNGGGKWYVADNETVTWDVANTDKAPVSAANVDIALSLDGGFTYPIILASGVPNTGSATVKVPNVATAKARVKVKGTGNYFIDISNSNFTIENPPTPTFIISTSPTNFAGCNLDSAVFYVKLTSISNFTTPVTFTASNIPSGATVVFAKNPAAPTDSVRVTVKNLKNVVTGKYNINVLTTAGTISNNSTIGLQLVNGAPAVTTNIAPANNATNLQPDATLFWNKKINTTQYVVDVSTSPAFSPILETAVVSDSLYKTTKLQVATVYYWRIKTRNPCADGPYSSTFAFQTTREGCTEYKSAIVALPIPDNEKDTLINELNIPGNFTISDLNVYVKLQHDFVQDLGVWVQAPDKSQLLMVQDSCLSSQDIDAYFDDEGYKFSCGFFPAVGGVIKPALQPLSIFDNKNSQGKWKLKIYDNATTYTGVFKEWRVNVCGVAGTSDLNITNVPITVTEKQTVTVMTVNLNAISTGATAPQMLYTLMAAPAQGKLKLSGGDLAVGSTFTQDDINTNKITYANNTANPTVDRFIFNVQANGGAWIGGTVFTFNLIATSVPLIATAAQNKSVGCFGGVNGSIVVTASGGTPPYQYSIDGGIFQSSNILTGLKAGTYTPKVKDAGGQSLFTNSVTVTEPTAIVATVTVSGNTTLKGNATGGTGTNYAFSWTTGSPQQSITVTAPNTYCFTVTDANSCTASACYLLIGPISATSQVSKSISCVGDANASITVSASGGVPPLEYQLNNGTYQSSNTFLNLAAGTYTTNVKDSKGTIKASNSVTIVAPTAVSVTGTVFGSTVTATGAGGTAPYTFNVDGGTYQVSKNFTNLANKTYTLGVKDGNGCVSTTSVVVNFIQLAATATFAEPTCNGDKTGTITVTATGGLAPVTYNINNGLYQNSNVFTGLGAGTYTVNAKDLQNTVKTLTVIVTEPTKVVVTATVLNNQLTAGASGGTPPYSYKLVGGNVNLTQTDPVFKNLPNTTLTLTATDGKGCKSIITSVINGLFDVADNLSFEVFPNPNQGTFTLSLAQPLNEKGIITMYDISGKMVTNQVISINEIQQKVEMANLPNGTYMLQITSGKFVGHKKVVVIK